MVTGMEDVLAAHSGHAFGREEADESRWFDKCECGHLLFGTDYSPEHKMRPGKSYANAAFTAHVAEALSAAGFGSQHDAWADGAATALDHAIQNDDGITLRLEHLDGRPWTNPYPSPKVSET